MSIENRLVRYTSGRQLRAARRRCRRLLEAIAAAPRGRTIVAQMFDGDVLVTAGCWREATAVATARGQERS